MIFVFVVDTSPSMGRSLSSDPSSSMSRLDLAKMTVESFTKAREKRVQEHNRQFQLLPAPSQQSEHNLGLGYCPADQFLLLSTGRQYVETAAAQCGGGGRLLVGYGDYAGFGGSNPQDQSQEAQQRQQFQGPPPTFGHGHGSFERELKRLRATAWELPRFTPPASVVGGQKPQVRPFPEDGGGAVGLNSALSAGLQLLSRYRLQCRSTENFGMGRLPSPAVLAPAAVPSSGAGGTGVVASSALQPACLVLLTDGECLTCPPSEGGGALQLQFGNMPLREFYRERESLCPFVLLTYRTFQLSSYCAASSFLVQNPCSY